MHIMSYCFPLLDVPQEEVSSQDIVTGDVTEAVKEQNISSIAHDSQKTMGLIR